MKSMSRVFVEIFNLVRKSENSVGILVLVDKLFDGQSWNILDFTISRIRADVMIGTLKISDISDLPD